MFRGLSLPLVKESKGGISSWFSANTKPASIQDCLAAFTADEVPFLAAAHAQNHRFGPTLSSCMRSNCEASELLRRAALTCGHVGVQQTHLYCSPSRGGILWAPLPVVVKQTHVHVPPSSQVLAGDDDVYYACDKCKAKTAATVYMRIHRFPRVLQLHIKRFKYAGPRRSPRRSSFFQTSSPSAISLFRAKARQSVPSA